MLRFLSCILLLANAWLAVADEVKIDHGGMLLNGNLVLVSESALSDGVILMLHGTLGHKDMEIMSTLQSIFAEYGRNSLAISLSLNVNDRHGFYPCDEPHTHKLGDAVAELRAWILWLEAMDVGDVVLLGHSRGANQVARYIIENRPPVGAAILIAPSVGGESNDADQAATSDMATPTEWLNDVPFLHCTGAKVSRESYESYYNADDPADTPALLQEIRIPVLVVSGSEDQVAIGLAARLATVERPNISHVEIEGADHFFRDLYAYDVVEHALEFIDAQ